MTENENPIEEPGNGPRPKPEAPKLSGEQLSILQALLGHDSLLLEQLLELFRVFSFVQIARHDLADQPVRRYSAVLAVNNEQALELHQHVATSALQSSRDLAGLERLVLRNMFKELLNIALRQARMQHETSATLIASGPKLVVPE